MVSAPAGPAWPGGPGKPGWPGRPSEPRRPATNKHINRVSECARGTRVPVCASECVSVSAWVRVRVRVCIQEQGRLCVRVYVCKCLFCVRTSPTRPNPRKGLRARWGTPSTRDEALRVLALRGTQKVLTGNAVVAGHAGVAGRAGKARRALVALVAGAADAAGPAPERQRSYRSSLPPVGVTHVTYSRTNVLAGLLPLLPALASANEMGRRRKRVSLLYRPVATARPTARAVQRLQYNIDIYT